MKDKDDEKSWIPGDCLSFHPSIRGTDNLCEDLDIMMKIS